jgi:HPt (histidine-containing phosphotransfer) domain-containing protein
MITDSDENPVLDPAGWQTLLDLWSDGDPQEFVDLIQEYLSDAQERLTRIQDGLRTGNGVQVAFESHTLKSGSANMAARHVESTSRAIEAAARVGDLTAASQSLPALEAALEETRRRLEAEIARRQPSAEA